MRELLVRDLAWDEVDADADANDRYRGGEQSRRHGSDAVRRFVRFSHSVCQMASGRSLRTGCRAERAEGGSGSRVSRAFDA
jgi:hypothetical protein